MESNTKKLHIAMFPWSAFGHMIPYLELAKLIAQQGHKVSFIATDKNIDRLPKPPPSISSLLTFIKLPLPAVPHLPAAAEATTDLPYDKVQYLKIAYDRLREPMKRFLQESAPDWVMYDFAPHWVGPVAAELGIPCAFFTIKIASLLVFVGPTAEEAVAGVGRDERTELEDYARSPKWVPFPTTVTFRVFEILKMSDSFTGNDSGVKDIDRLKLSLKGVVPDTLAGPCPRPQWNDMAGKSESPAAQHLGGPVHSAHKESTQYFMSDPPTLRLP